MTVKGQKETKAELAMKETVTETVAELQLVKTIECAEDELAANDRLKLVSAARKKVVAFFKPIKQSIDASKKTVLEREKEVLAPVLEEESRIRAEMARWRTEQSRRIAEREAKLEEEHGIPVKIEMDEVAPQVKYRRYWHFKVINAEKLRSEFTVPDEKSIQKVVNAMHENASTTVGEGSIKVYYEDRPYNR